MTRPHAGTFAGPLGHVRYVSRACGKTHHHECRGGPDRRIGELPCSCECHDDAFRAALAFLSTRCKLAKSDRDHGECPPLEAEVPGRRERISVPCTCQCHRSEKR